jgi:tetratricopeptide (TPR) repeat protein
VWGLIGSLALMLPAALASAAGPPGATVPSPPANAAAFDPVPQPFLPRQAHQMSPRDESHERSMAANALGARCEGEADAAKARAVFDDAIVRSPEAPGGYVERGAFLVGRIERARSLLPRDPRKTTRQPDARQALDTKRALADFARAIATAGGDPVSVHWRAEALWWRASLLWHSERTFDQAIADLSKAIELEPRNFRNFLARGNLHEFKKDDALALTDYTEAIRCDPAQAKGYFSRGCVYQASGDDNKAVADFNRAMAIGPRQSRWYVKRGISYSRQGEFDRAMADYRQAIVLNPREAEAYRCRASVWTNLGELDAAIEDLNAVERLEPTWTSVLLLRASIRINQHREAEALTDLDRARTLNPDSAPVALLRIKAYTQLGSLERARAERERAIQAGPELAFAVLAAEILDAQHAANYDQALALCNRLESRFPNDVDALLVRGAVLLDKGDDLGVARVSERVLALQPDSELAHLLLGSALLHRNEPARSLASFDRAAQLAPQQAATFAGRGYAHASLGNLDSAIADFSESLRLLTLRSDQRGMAAPWHLSGQGANTGLVFGFGDDHHAGTGPKGSRLFAWPGAVVDPIDLYVARASAYLRQWKVDRACADALSAFAALATEEQAAAVWWLTRLTHKTLVENVVAPL